MGLDITAYSHLVAVDCPALWGCPDGDHISVFTYNAFPQSFRGIAVRGARPGKFGLLFGGCYVATEQTETHSFGVGGYSGYGKWRASLAYATNPGCSPDEPFYELIDFADSAGSIGPDAARDLLRDFEQFARWDFASQSRLYAHFHRACELAANNGIVRFD